MVISAASRPSASTSGRFSMRLSRKMTAAPSSSMPIGATTRRSFGVITVLSGTEITHSAPQILTAGTITFRFRWTAPATPGTYSITAAGNAVNFNGASSGDGWNIARPLTLTVPAAFTGGAAG